MDLPVLQLQQYLNSSLRSLFNYSHYHLLSGKAFDTLLAFVCVCLDFLSSLCQVDVMSVRPSRFWMRLSLGWMAIDAGEILRDSMSERDRESPVRGEASATTERPVYVSRRKGKQQLRAAKQSAKYLAWSQ